MNIIFQLSDIHAKFVKSFTKWYIQNYNNDLNINTFIILPSIYQLSSIYKYIRTMYGLGINYDEFSIVIYYLDPNNNSSVIVDNYLNGGKFNNIAFAKYKLKELDMIEAFERAIITLLDNLNGKNGF
jgi:hypothetical protein